MFTRTQRDGSAWAIFWRALSSTGWSRTCTPVDVRIGLTDGTSTEFVEGPLTEGAKVILGTGNPAAETKNETPRRR